MRVAAMMRRRRQRLVMYDRNCGQNLPGYEVCGKLLVETRVSIIYN